MPMFQGWYGIWEQVKMPNMKYENAKVLNMKYGNLLKPLNRVSDGVHVNEHLNNELQCHLIVQVQF